MEFLQISQITSLDHIRVNEILLLSTETKNPASKHDVQCQILLVESIALIILNPLENSLVNGNIFLRGRCEKNQISNSPLDREP